jgi:hypothetical protein
LLANKTLEVLKVGLKWSALFIAIVGVVCLVFGIMAIIEAGNSEQEVADEIAPIQLSQLDATYDQASAAYKAVRGTGAQEESTLLLQKTSLGLARSNIGTINFVKNTAILEIVIGAGLVLASAGLFRQS